MDLFIDLIAFVGHPDNIKKVGIIALVLAIGFYFIGTTPFLLAFSGYALYRTFGGHRTAELRTANLQSVHKGKGNDVAVEKAQKEVSLGNIPGSSGKVPGSGITDVGLEISVLESSAETTGLGGATGLGEAAGLGSIGLGGATGLGLGGVAEMMKSELVTAESYEFFDLVDSKSTMLVRITAWYAGVHVLLNEDLEEVDGVSPVLRTSEGDITGTAAILRFLARDSEDLYGETDFEKSLVDSWLDWGYANITANAEAYLLPAERIPDMNYYSMKEASEEILENLVILNNHLQANTFLSARNITIADITLAFTIKELFTTVYSKKDCSKFSAVSRWVNTILNQPIILVFCDPSSFSFQNQSAIPPNPPKRN